MTKLETLNAWQSTAERLDKEITKALDLISLESQFIQAIFAASEHQDRLVSQITGIDYRLLSDWRVFNEFGRYTMIAIVDEFESRMITNNRELVDYWEYVKCPNNY